MFNSKKIWWLFICLLIFTSAQVIFAQYSSYPVGTLNIERYVTNVTQYVTYSTTSINHAYVGKSDGLDPSGNKNTFRMIYLWDLSSIPTNATISTCTLSVKATITTNSTANPYTYGFIIKQFPDANYGSFANTQWSTIDNSTALDQQTAAPLGGIISGTLNYSSGSSFVNYIQNCLSQRKVDIAVVGADEDWNGPTINIGDFKGSTFLLNISYTVPPSIVSFSVDNNFTVPNGTHGNVIVNGTTYSAPHTFSNITAGTTFTLQAVSPQTDNQGYQRVWNTSGVATSLSSWQQYNGTYNLKSNNSQYSFTVSSSDNSTTYIANLMKICNITFQNNFAGISNSGVITVNGTQYNSPTSSFLVVEQNPITATAIDQTIGGVKYYFHNWSDGNASYTDTFYPTGNTTYTAALISADALTASGPSSIIYGQNGTWTASVSLGFAPYTYQWYFDYPNPNTLALTNSVVKPNLLPYDHWYPLGTNSPTLTTSFVQQAYIKCIVTDSKGLTGTSNILSVGVTYSNANSSSSNNAVLGKLETKQTEEIQAIRSYALEQNFPNPFNPSTIINYQLPKDGFVSLKVFDVVGNEVKTLVNGFKSAGSYSVNFDASHLASGMYFYRLQANDYISIKKMILMK
ncbi:MAG: T9SS type A sorting domain-containing protein [Ignavibacteriaceae bacterium]